MPFPITIDLSPGGGVHRIRNGQELTAFVDEEWNAWTWLGSARQFNQPNARLNQIIQVYQRSSSLLQGIRQQLIQGNPESAESQLKSYLSDPSLLPPTESVIGKFIIKSYADIGPGAGIGALCTLRNFHFDGGDPEQIRGAIIAHEFMQGTGSTARQSVQTAFSQMLKRLSDQQTRAEDRADKFDKRAEQLDQRRRRQFNTLLSVGEHARKQFSEKTLEDIQRIEGSAAESITKLESVRGTFEEFMRLKAPVTYWRKKAITHKSNARIAAGIGLIFSSGLIWIACAWGFQRVLDLVYEAISHTHMWQVAYVILTMSVFLLTIAFWIGRLISRTYVSQTHLAIDAEERATMVETYLALTKENQISNDERILVLTSLFRASSDGLVKDDGAPDLSLAGLASRLGTTGPATTR